MEYAVVVLIFIGVIFAVIDFSRAMWAWNMAEKATQRGVRAAAVSDYVAANLLAWDGTANGFAPGDAIPISEFAVPIVCKQDAGPPGQCLPNGGWNQTAFDNIVAAMQGLYPGVTADVVTVEYRHVGRGVAGRPAGPDVEPLITVKLEGLQFSFYTPLLPGMTLSMPDFRASLTSEDGST